MGHFYKFAVIRLTPDERRGETINIGLVVMGSQGVDVRVLPTMQKVQALNAAFDTDTISQLPEIIERWAADRWKVMESFEAFGSFGPVSVVEIGEFSAHDDVAYRTEVEDLMTLLVYPPKRGRTRNAKSRVKTDLRQVFERHKLLSPDPADATKGYVVQHYPVAPSLELYVDFAVKNGLWHFINTIDFRVKPEQHAAKHREACAVSFALETAEQEIRGHKERIVVYADEVQSTDDITPHLNILKRGAQHLINIRDRSAINDLVSDLAHAKWTHQTDQNA